MDTKLIKKMVRIGTVSAVNGASCRARVTFTDEDNLVSRELPIIVIGSLQTKAYWVPEVGTQVLCIFLPNVSGNGFDAGFVVGAFYSSVDAPVESDASVRSITFADGSFIKYEGGNIEINAKGNVVIKGANILLN